MQGTPEREVHLLDLLLVFAERWKFILSLSLGASIFMAVLSFLLPNQYKAEAVVLPPSQSSSMSSALLSQMGGASALTSLAGGSLGMKNPGDMYVALFRTESVEDALIKRFGLMERYHTKKMSDTRKTFEGASDVVLGSKDGLIRVSIIDRDPKMAADLANGYIDEFRNLSAHLAITEASQRRAFFEKELQEVNANLVLAEEAMKSTEQSTGLLHVDSQARALIESAASLRGQIGAKEVELRALHSYATEDNPQVVMAKQQLEGLKALFAQLTGKSADSSSDILVPKGNIPNAQIAYLRSYRNIQYYQTVKEILAKQFEMAKLDEAREGATIQVAQTASPPDTRTSPKRKILTLIVFVLSFIAACGWCIFRDAIERLKNNPAEHERIEALRAAFRN